MSRNRNYCFTLNNYQDNQVQQIKELGGVNYIGFGYEVAPSTGTPHLQGYINFSNSKTFSAVKKLLPDGCHIEVCKGLPSQNMTYCEKEGNFWESGTRPKDPKKNIQNNWQNIAMDIEYGISWKDLLKKYPREAMTSTKGLRTYYEECRPKNFTQIEDLYPWQKKLQDILDEGIHSRQIIWIWDSEGNAGKSSMAKHLLASGGWCVFANAKTADIAHAWQGENVVFDFARSQMDHLNYEVIEKIKDGVIFSAKYESMTKIFSIPHVVVFANAPPDESKMSRDRWNIKQIQSKYI